jgi:hypothetical protein
LAFEPLYIDIEPATALHAAYARSYINIDDLWAAHERAPDGSLVPDPVKFPSGMKNLSDYIHAKGLKFGLCECFIIEDGHWTYYSGPTVPHHKNPS